MPRHGRVAHKAMGRLARRIVHGRKPRYLLSGAAISLLGYALLALLAAHQAVTGLDYGVRTWIALLRYEFLNLPMRVLTALGDNLGLIPLIALGVAVLWRVSRRWAIALPFLMLSPRAPVLASGRRSPAAQRLRPGLPERTLLTSPFFLPRHLAGVHGFTPAAAVAHRGGDRAGAVAAVAFTASISTSTGCPTSPGLMAVWHLSCWQSGVGGDRGPPRSDGASSQDQRMTKLSVEIV